MKKLLVILFVALLAFFLHACHESQIGYLLTKDAVYKPDTLLVRLTPDPVLDVNRKENKAPWVTLKMQGYDGTSPITFSVESVTSSAGEEAARLFKEDVYTRGGGVLLYPFEPKNRISAGRYVVSVRLTNEGCSEVVKNALTFVVVE